MIERGTVFTSRNHPKKPWSKRGGIGVLNLTDEIVHKLMVEERG